MVGRYFSTATEPKAIILRLYINDSIPDNRRLPNCKLSLIIAAHLYGSQQYPAVLRSLGDGWPRFPPSSLFSPTKARRLLRSSKRTKYYHDGLVHRFEPRPREGCKKAGSPTETERKTKWKHSRPSLNEWALATCTNRACLSLFAPCAFWSLVLALFAAMRGADYYIVSPEWLDVGCRRCVL
ncbi:hypothetical protein M440DRAFT_131400 [Trichoderma longibrachiatum ATCC 18648]|uniref:Uncharacterized protein n=1 Tax=Trichoderma longibrachiatum ATCC 18648 TaxID=983965 RepID=A0A2T4BVV2_TRILO|nr:hypothetical protein M440DRAFT_131400 [Trichoderma longibrachiatum ATCC 18648]